MLTNSKYQIFVWMMFMTLLGCKLSAWVKKIWIFSFWLFSDTPYCIVVKSQQKSTFSILIQLVKAYISFCELIFGLIYIKIITLGVDIYIFWYNSVWHSAFLARNFPICKLWNIQCQSQSLSFGIHWWWWHEGHIWKYV